MSPVENASIDTHPLKVPNLVTKFGVKAYTIREWAKARRLSGARRIGREWRFPLDVDYVQAPEPVTVEDEVKGALQALRAYEVGKPRAN